MYYNAHHRRHAAEMLEINSYQLITTVIMLAFS